MQSGPIQDILTLQTHLKENFTTLNSLLAEAGTCKKVIQLVVPQLGLDYPNLAVAFTHERNQQACDIIHHEHYFLRLLKEKGFHVISLHGDVFLLEENNHGKRYAMLMDYIPNAVFIECKTPATLNLLIVSALLGIKVRAQEAWVLMHRDELLRQVQERLSIPESLAHLNTTAHTLAENFERLIHLSATHSLEINDLQILITADGRLTIIDPLDIIIENPQNKTTSSILKPEIPLNDGNLQLFLSRTRQWLQNAKQCCEKLKEVKSADEVLTMIQSTPASTVLCFAACDSKQKSRIAHLRQGAVASPPQNPSPNTHNRNKPQ